MTDDNPRFKDDPDHYFPQALIDHVIAQAHTDTLSDASHIQTIGRFEKAFFQMFADFLDAEWQRNSRENFDFTQKNEIINAMTNVFCRHFCSTVIAFAPSQFIQESLKRSIDSLTASADMEASSQIITLATKNMEARGVPPETIERLKTQFSKMLEERSIPHRFNPSEVPNA